MNYFLIVLVSVLVALASIIIYMLSSIVKKNKETSTDTKSQELLLKSEAEIKFLKEQNLEHKQNLSVLSEKLSITERDLASTRTSTEHANNSIELLAQEKDKIKIKFEEEIDFLSNTIKKLESERNALYLENSKLTEHNTLIEQDRDRLVKKELQFDEYKSITEPAIADLKAQNKALDDRHNTLKEQYDKYVEKEAERESHLRLKFSELSNESLRATNELFTKKSAEQIGNIINPIKEQFIAFEKSQNEIKEKNIENFSGLNKAMEFFNKQGMVLGEQTDTLIKALRGKNKMQGAWGEALLEKVLEVSGFTEGLTFVKQAGYKDEDNKNKIPDIIIHLPKDRTVVVDSKVSLVHYLDYIEAHNDADKDSAIKKMVGSIKAHIDALSSKEYHKVENSMDYVLMFMPIESAHLLAISTDATLYDYALKRKIIIVNPSTLLAVLSTFQTCWQNEKASKNVEEIIDIAKKLYQSLQIYTESHNAVGKALGEAQKHHEMMGSRLTNGSASVRRYSERLIEHGVKPTQKASKNKNKTQKGYFGILETNGGQINIEAKESSEEVKQLAVNEEES